MLRVSFSTLNWQEGEWIFWVSDETKMVIHHLTVTGVWWRKCPIFTEPIYFSSGIQLYYNSIPVASKGGHEANSHQRNENGSDHCHIWDEAVRRAVPSHGNFLFRRLHIGGSPGDSEALMVRIQDRRILGSLSDCMVQSPTVVKARKVVDTSFSLLWVIQAVTHTLLCRNILHCHPWSLSGQGHTLFSIFPSFISFSHLDFNQKL